MKKQIALTNQTSQRDIGLSLRPSQSSGTAKHCSLGPMRDTKQENQSGYRKTF